MPDNTRPPRYLVDPDPRPTRGVRAIMSAIEELARKRGIGAKARVLYKQNAKGEHAHCSDLPFMSSAELGSRTPRRRGSPWALLQTNGLRACTTRRFARTDRCRFVVCACWSRTVRRLRNASLDTCERLRPNRSGTRTAPGTDVPKEGDRDTALVPHSSSIFPPPIVSNSGGQCTLVSESTSCGADDLGRSLAYPLLSRRSKRPYSILPRLL